MSTNDPYPSHYLTIRACICFNDKKYYKMYYGITSSLVCGISLDKINRKN